MQPEVNLRLLIEQLDNLLVTLEPKLESIEENDLAAVAYERAVALADALRALSLNDGAATGDAAPTISGASPLSREINVRRNDLSGGGGGVGGGGGGGGGRGGVGRVSGGSRGARGRISRDIDNKRAIIESIRADRSAHPRVRAEAERLERIVEGLERARGFY